MSLRSRPLSTTLVVALLLAVLGGCASEEAAEPAETETPPAQETPAEAPATPSATPEACTLLTVEEIETATGVAPGAGEPVGGACTWAAADGSNPRLLALTVQHGDVTRERWLGGGGSEEDIVEGVGDFAAMVGSQLQVYQGGWLVGVTVRGSDRAEAARELARAVLARLGE